METKQSARELLKEAREKINEAIYFVEKTEGSGEGQFMLPTLAHIDAYLAASSESAMEMVDKIRETHTTGRGFESFDISDSEAAALIEGY